MNYRISLLALLALGGLSLHSMERDSQVHTLSIQEDSTSMMSCFTQLPSDLKRHILSLSLELRLSYNFSCIKELQIEQSTSLAFSPDGKTVIRGSRDGTVRLVDSSTGRLLQEFTGHTDYISSVAFSPDGNIVLTGSFDKTARLWDTKTGRLIQVLKGHQSWVAAVAFSPDGNTVLTGGTTGDCTGRLWDVKTGKEISVLQGHSCWVASVAISTDGKIALTGSLDKTIRLWDATMGRHLKQFKEGWYAQGPKDFVVSVASSPDGKSVLCGTCDGTASLWDRSTGERLALLDTHCSSVRRVVFSADGSTIVTASDKGTVHLWDVKTDKQLQLLSGHTHSVAAVLLSPCGNSLITGSTDGKIRWWRRLGGSSEWLKTRREVAHELFMTLYPSFMSSSERDCYKGKEPAPVLSFTEGVDLEDDSQKECRIQ